MFVYAPPTIELSSSMPPTAKFKMAARMLSAVFLLKVHKYAEEIKIVALYCKKR